MTLQPEPNELCPANDKTVVQPHKKTLLIRMDRIAGQVKGIANMIESDRYCVDILTQVSAIKSALDAVAMEIVEDHNKYCVQKAIQQGDGDAAITDLMDVLKKINR